jgi:hypothetical protein
MSHITLPHLCDVLGTGQLSQKVIECMPGTGRRREMGSDYLMDMKFVLGVMKMF